MMPNKNNKLRVFLKDKGFYLVLAVCIVGASAAAWLTANKTLNSIEQNNREITQQSEGSSATWQDTEPRIIPEPPVAGVEKNLPDIKEPRPSASSLSQPSSSSSSSAGSSEALPQQKPEQRLAQSPYTLPMPSLAVIQPYSNGELVKNKTLNVWRTHDAVDLKGDKGATVCAISDGVITTMGTDPLWGGFVEIKHPDGIVSSCSGVTPDKNLKKGATVKGGQKIGTLCDIPAEISMEPHLHLSMKKGSAYLDPGLYLKLK
ncbi:MAG: M23 family metallopeptidase [Angelakisella sp.]